MSASSGFPPGTPGFGTPPPRRSTGVVVSVAAAAVAVIALIAVTVWNFVLDPVTADPGPGQGPTASATIDPGPTEDPTGDPTTEAPPTTTAPPTTAPPTTEAPVAFPAGAKPCPVVYAAVGGTTRSAAGNDVTSCPFAEEVRRVYGSQPVRDAAVDITATSPVTGSSYDMTCSGGRLVTCVGGNNAVVHII